MFHIREIGSRGRYLAVMGGDVVMETYNDEWARGTCTYQLPR